MSIAEVLTRYGASLTRVEDKVWLLDRETGVSAYDFDVRSHFDCSHPYEVSAGPAIARLGAIEDYDGLHAGLAEEGLQLINNPQQYRNATDLTRWYASLEDLSPRSRWWSEPPTSGEVASEFEWPVFVKGERQTNRHDAASVVRGAQEFDALMTRWRTDEVLGWQQVVVREFLSLRPVRGDTGSKVGASFEFRSFWWEGELLGAGPYWSEFARYEWDTSEQLAALSVGRKAANRIDSRFLVVDLAQTIGGDWVVIELNEAQESGYVGVPRMPLWRALLDKVE